MSGQLHQAQEIKRTNETKTLGHKGYNKFGRACFWLVKKTGQFLCAVEKQSNAKRKKQWKKIESLLSENRAKPSFFFLKAKLYRIEYFSPISQRTVTWDENIPVL